MQGPDFYDEPEPREDIDRQVARIMGEPYAGDVNTVAFHADLGKTLLPPVAEKTDEPRRKRPRVSFLPDYVAREHDGPDPKTLPRRARRMRVPGRHEFHLHGRERRRPAS